MLGPRDLPLGGRPEPALLAVLPTDEQRLRTGVHRGLNPVPIHVQVDVEDVVLVGLQRYDEGTRRIVVGLARVVPVYFGKHSAVFIAHKPGRGLFFRPREHGENDGEDDDDGQNGPLHGRGLLDFSMRTGKKARSAGAREKKNMAAHENREMRVLKFGGTSMARMARVLDIVRDAGPCVLVVSALGASTEMLRQRDFEGLRRLYAPYAKEYGVEEAVETAIDNAERGCAAVPGSRRLDDWVLSYGEKTTAFLLQAAVEARLGRPAMVCDDVTVEGPHGDARVVAVNLPDAAADVVVIVPGFYGYDKDDDSIKTIGRSGSDIMAAAVARNAPGAYEVVIYTDVHGIFTADPRVARTAVCFEEMHALDAVELGYAGGSVLHPRTVQFLLGTGIDLRVRHVGADAGGTLVTEKTSRETRAVAVRAGQVLLSVEDTGMHGIPGIAGGLFGALTEAGVNVSFITQSCSETCITFAVDREDVDRCAGVMAKVTDVRPVAIVSLVGGNMRSRIGVAAGFFRALSAENVNVLAIGQGGTERSISAVVAEADAHRAVEAVNDMVCVRTLF